MHRFELLKYDPQLKKRVCPKCKKREFQLYIDNYTQSPIDDSVGRCDRISKCGYHYTPKDYFTDNGGIKNYNPKLKAEKYQNTFLLTENIYKMNSVQMPSFIDNKLLEKSQRLYNQNAFCIALYHLFGKDETLKAIEKYKIGTSNKYELATTFWQIDINNNIRAGKIFKYNPKTLRRDKHCTNWVHSILKLENFNLVQCFFGEHLLNENTNKVCVVESYKSAIILSIFYPDYVWLAADNINGLNEKKMEVLKDREILLFPDLGDGERLWKEQAKYYKSIGYNIQVDTVLRKFASEYQIAEGWDIADYFIKKKIYDMLGSEIMKSLVDNLGLVCNSEIIKYYENRA